MAKLCTFYYRPEVAPENDASEQAIRYIKVKHKESGQFRSSHGAFRFATLPSISDTVLKNNISVLWALSFIENKLTV